MSAASTMAARNEEAPHRDQYVRRALARSASLVSSCAQLAQGSHSLALQILHRAIVEDFIRLHWVTLSEENANYVESIGVDEIRKLVRTNVKSGILNFRKKYTGEDVTDSVVGAGLLLSKTKRKVTFETMARDADILHLYDIFYRFGSMTTHGNEGGSPSWNKIGDVVANLNQVGAFNKALGHAGVMWLMWRERPSNESLRTVLGLNELTESAAG